MRLAIVFVLMATALSAQIPEPAPAGSAAQGSAGNAAAPPPAGKADNGAKIYLAYGCWECHGYVAQGGGYGPKLAPKPIPFAALTRYVRKPTGQMPPYTAKVVTDQELADIYAFLLTIPQPPDPNSITLMKP